MQNNPFILAFNTSDFLGKLIFIALIATSICCWITLIHKALMTRMARKHSISFENFFINQAGRPLDLHNEGLFKNQSPNPFYQIYLVLKKQTIDLLSKNHRFGLKKGENSSYLTSNDLDFVESHVMVTIANQTKNLEKNLYLLSTIVGLAPLLGLLGTVWGILITFSDLQNQSGNSQEMLGGLSLALTTTVLGLVSAIPALIAYNYLKNDIRNLETEMESFSTLMLSSVELQYRKVDAS